MTISIDLPPINDAIVDDEGKLTAVWRDWFSTNIGTLITYITQFGIQLPPISSTERDSLISPKNGLVIQNGTTGEPQVYTSGAWKNILHS